MSTLSNPVEFNDDDQPSSPSLKHLVKNPRDTHLRWVAVALASFLVFGNDYCYDLPQALEVPIQDNFKVSEVQYNLLYSVYSLPNIIMPFFGGYLLDYFGIRVGIILYNSLLIFGQTLFTIGCYSNNYHMLILGRAVFGIGAESLNVAQSTIVTMWFKGKELSTALGISLCICRLGSSLNSFLSPLLYEYLKNLGGVSFAGLAFLIISLVCGVFLIKMDEKYLKEEKFENTEKIEVKDIKQLNSSFWLMYLNAILCFMSFFSFLNISNKYLQNRFEFKQTEAGGLLTIPYAVAGVLTPILSYIIDKKGKKASLLIFTCFLLSFNHFSMENISDCDGCLTVVWSLMLFGVFFALYTSVLIPAVSVIVEEKVTGTALGIIYSGQNTGLAIGPLIVGSILKNYDLKTEYSTMSMVLGGCAFIAGCDAIANWWYDKFYNGGILQKNMKELEIDATEERKLEIEIPRY